MTATRRGAVLLITAGLCALLAALTLAFLVRMRLDAAEARWVARNVQSRIMLYAACAYILETGRIGWNDPGTAGHEECYGWVDVRDGYLGPKPDVVLQSDRMAILGPDRGGPDLSEAQRWQAIETFATSAASPRQRPGLPIGASMRCPMEMWERPPWAISSAPANPIQSIPGPKFGQPFLSNPSPMIAGGTPGADSSTIMSFAAWAQGDPRRRTESLGLAWFRVYRDGPATFVVTVGSGGTLGFRSWAEIPPTEQALLFPSISGERFFRLAQAEGYRAWYRVEWSPAIAYDDNRYSQNHQNDNYRYHGIGSADYGRFTALPSRDNACGTIQWVQRLRDEPLNW